MSESQTVTLVAPDDPEGMYECSDGRRRMGLEPLPLGVTVLHRGTMDVTEQQERSMLVLPPGLEADEPVDVAPAPPRHLSQRSQQQKTLLTDQEFAVLDLLAEADGIFMQIPQAEEGQRELWRSGLLHLENMIMRRAAIRAYPQRFVGE